MRLLRGFLLIIVVAVACSAAAWYWLLHTNAGAVWVMAKAESLTDGAFTTRSLDGDLTRGLGVGGVAYNADGVDVTAASASVAIDVDLLPFSVEIVTARIEGARVAISEATDSQAEPTDMSATLRKLQLPFRLRLSDVVVDGLAVESPGFRHTISLLELAAEWHDSIVIERLRADGEDIYIEGDATFDLASDLVHIGNVRVRLDPGITGQPEAIEIGIQSEGDPDRLGLQVDVENFAAEASGEIRHLFEQPVWDIDVAVQHYLLPLKDGAESIEFRDLSARSTGSLAAWSLEATGDIHAPGMQWLSVGIAGEGTQHEFTAGMLRADGADLEATGTARIVWSAERVLETSLAITRVDPQFLWSAWPDGFPVRGTVNAVLDDTRFLINDSRLFVPRAGAELQLDADIDRADGHVQGALRWQNLRWPLEGDAYDVKSDLADLRVVGTLDAWSVDGTIEIGIPDMPVGTFRIDGSGDRDVARVSVLEANMLGGTLEGEVEYSWRGKKPWRGLVHASSIETEPLFSEWPGRVSGRVEASGELEPMALSARFTEVTGTLLGRSLEADGGFSLADNRLVVNEFSATHGSSRFKADGGLDDVNGLAFELAIADAADYVTDLSGDLSGSGVIRTAQDQSYLSLTVDAGELQYDGVVISDLHIEDVRRPEQLVGVRLTADGILIGDREFSDIAAELDATTEQQSLAASGTYLNSGLSFSLEGALVDWSAPLTAGWRGVLKTFEVFPDDQYVARLLSPADIFVSSERVDVAEACVGPDANATVCAAGNWTANGVYAASARFSSVPVDLLDYVADTGLAFDQLINGEIQWAHRPETGPSGFGQLSMTPGRISSVESPQLTLATGQGVLNFRIADNKLLNGTLGLPLPGTGEINGTFQLHDLENIEGSGIVGGIVGDVSEIAILSPLIPAIDRASGRLRVDVNLTGSVAAPLLRGSLTINDGSLAFDPLGLVLEDLNLTARMAENYRVDLDGEFRAGDGHGKVTALADYINIDEPILQIGFEGERLTLINVEDIRVAADPDFDLTLTSNGLLIGGSIHVPEALVTPVNRAVAPVHESSDVVIVAGNLPDPPDPDPVGGLQYSGSLDVSLGDNVVIDLDVARASVSGKVTFDWRGESMPFANGRYDIVGTIDAFGQVLDISRGTVRFPDVPADSPIVRIRAEREIYGNTQVKRAGVLVDGPLMRPNINAYTQPPSTEERALTLLVTGSDFDYEQGVGAIDFGTYIAPRLFISYGIGVFDRDNIVSARFDLTKAFGIKASSGDKETGVDLNFRFER